MRNLVLLVRLLKSTKDYELRIYDVYPFVTTPYERRDEGFLALGSYMEGHNSEAARMNLTQPIVMRYESATVSSSLQSRCVKCTTKAYCLQLMLTVCNNTLSILA